MTSCTGYGQNNIIGSDGDLKLLCRGCLARSEKMKNMFEWGLVDDFYELTDIQINSDKDSLSCLICTCCEKLLKTYKNFRLRCQQSDYVLKDKLKRTGPNKFTLNEGLNEINQISECLENSISCVLNDNNQLDIYITAPNMNSKIYLTCPFATETKCHDSFLKKKYLLSHLIRSHHLDENKIQINLKYYCSYNTCRYHRQSPTHKYFTERKFLNQHFNKVHGDKIFACSSCNFSCATSVELDRHVKTCGKVYLCELCNKNYNTNESLLVHLMRNHPDIHEKYKNKRTKKRISETTTQTKRVRTEHNFPEFVYESPKRSSATQTILPEEVRNDVTLTSYNPVKSDAYEISTQTVFEDILSLKSQISEDDSISFSEIVSLSDIQTQTFPVEFGLSRSNKETITSETQSPDLSIKETQTCYCLYDSPKTNFKLFDSINSSPLSINLTSTETQTGEAKTVKSDVLLSFSSTETQTNSELEDANDSL